MIFVLVYIKFFQLMFLACLRVSCNLFICLWLFQFAEELPLLLSVCFFGNYSMYLCVFHLSFLHQGSDGSLSRDSLGGNERIPCICYINGILFHLFVVCRWINWLSFVPYWHKSGQLISFTFLNIISGLSHCSLYLKTNWLRE